MATFFVLPKIKHMGKRIPPLMHERLSENLQTVSPHDAETINNALDLLIDYLDIESIDASPVITFEDEIAGDQK